jgi:hypothetical protein
VATGPATAQQFQALDVFAQAREPVRLAREDERQPWASAEPDAEGLCERAKASKKDYIPIWRDEFLNRNAMTAAYFDEHVRVIDTTVQCWLSGATFRIAYRVSYEWTSAEHTDEFLILLYEHEPAWRHRDVPRNTLFNAADVSRAIDWRIGSAHIGSVAMLGELQFPTRDQAIAALERAAHGKIGDSRQYYLDRRPHLDAEGIISSPENRCFRGDLDLVTGKVDVREGPCRIGEPWPTKAVAPDSPCDSPGHCAPSLSWPSDPEWRCSPEAIRDELTAEWTIVTSVDVIPRDVRSALDIKFMANPGEPWNSGCVQDGRLPGSQLVFAAHTPRMWFLSARHGGFAIIQSAVFVCRDYDGDWVYSAGQHPVDSLSDLRTVPETSIQPGHRRATQPDAVLRGLEWVLPAGQWGRDSDADATQLRGVVLTGERFGDRKGVVLASIDVWLPAQDFRNTCRKEAGPTFPLSEDSIVDWSAEEIRLQFVARDLERIAARVKATEGTRADCEAPPAWIRFQVLTADHRRTPWF